MVGAVLSLPLNPPATSSVLVPLLFCSWGWLCLRLLPPLCQFRGCVSLNAGKVLLQRGEEVADHRHTPGATQQSLPSQTAHVGHICVVDREAKDPVDAKRASRGQLPSRTAGPATRPHISMIFGDMPWEMWADRRPYWGPALSNKIKICQREITCKEKKTLEELARMVSWLEGRPKKKSAQASDSVQKDW